MKRFIIISTLPEPLFSRIQEEQKELNAITGAKEAMLYPPHITLRTGALVPEDKIESYVVSFRNHIKNIKPCTLSSKSIVYEEYLSDGKTHYFIGYSLTLSSGLYDCHNTLWDFPKYAKSKRSDFNPHVSLAYKDLSTSNFEKAKLEWNSSDLEPLEWFMDTISLYHIEDNRWQEYARFSLTSL